MSASALLESLKGTLDWEWDDRFEGILATFDSSEAEVMSGLLGEHLGHRWDSESAANAPELVAQALQSVGGVAPGQLVFSSDPGQTLVMLGLWWPWNNGSTISIRLLPLAAESNASELQSAYELLRTYC